MAIPQDDPLLCGLAWATKVCASGLFHTDRDPARTFRESCNWMAASDELVRAAIKERNPGPLMALSPGVELLEELESLSLTLDGRTAHARRFGHQGVAVVDRIDQEPDFSPMPVPRSTYSGIKTPLDIRGIVPEAGITGAQQGLIADAETAVFENPREMTNALLVLHKGQLLSERYREPFGAETRFESWSMGKTIAATLFGVALQQGAVDLDMDALFEDWSGTEDPRREIKARNLLNMASGLEFSGSYGRTEDTSRKQENGRFLDHIYVYAGGVNSHEFCIGKPLSDTPGQSGRYRNCDPLLTMGLIRERACHGSVQDFLTWPYEQLLNRIGANGMVLETDRFGHFLISGHDYGRARDWARLGQLHLQRGAWGGEQILPESFAEFVRAPAREAWPPGHAYGGFTYVNADKIMPTLPEDAFIMSGGGRQRTVIVPSLDLVIVRLGHINGQGAGLEATLNDAYAKICAAVS
ncbi:MAG: serine hydrolase [Pseudomonadota bacterium]